MAFVKMFIRFLILLSYAFAVIGLMDLAIGCGADIDQYSNDGDLLNNSVGQTGTSRHVYKPRFSVYEDLFTDKICIGFDSYSATQKIITVILSDGDTIRPSSQFRYESLKDGTETIKPVFPLVYSFYPPNDSMSIRIKSTSFLYDYQRRVAAEKTNSLEYFAEISIRISPDSLLLAPIVENGIFLENKSHKRLSKDLKGCLYRINVPAQYDYDDVSKFFIDSLATIGAENVNLMPGDYHYFSIPLQNMDNNSGLTKAESYSDYFRYNGPLEIMRYRFRILSRYIRQGSHLFTLDYFPDNSYYSLKASPWNNIYDPHTIESRLDYSCEIFEYNQTGLLNVVLKTRDKYLSPGNRLYLNWHETQDGIVIRPEVQKSTTVGYLSQDSTYLVGYLSFTKPLDSFNLYITEYGDTAKFVIKYNGDSVLVTPQDETPLKCPFYSHKRLDRNISWITMFPMSKYGSDSLSIFVNRLRDYFKGYGIETIMPADGFYPMRIFDSIPSIRRITTDSNSSLIQVRDQFGLWKPVLFFNFPGNDSTFTHKLSEFLRSWGDNCVMTSWEQIDNRYLR